MPVSVIVIVTPSSPSASTATSSGASSLVRVIEPLTVKVSLSAQTNLVVVSDEIAVSQSPALENSENIAAPSN